MKYNHLASVEVVARFLRTRPGAGLLSAASGRAGIACAVRDLPDLPGEEVLNTKPVELAGLLGTCAAARAQDLQREAR